MKDVYHHTTADEMMARCFTETGTQKPNEPFHLENWRVLVKGNSAANQFSTLMYLRQTAPETMLPVVC